jgi:NAD(P)H dehydrogenase (quinone)
MTRTILISGASGHLGRGVIHHLLESNGVPPECIVATTRTPEKLAGLPARGVAVRFANFDDAASLDGAFAGAQTILIVSTDLLDLINGGRLRQHQIAVAAAMRVGAEHIAYTSMPKPEPGSPIPFAGDHYGTEQALKTSGLSYTIFRNNAYHENLITLLPTIVASERWYTSAGDGRVAYAARDDVAAAIAGHLAGSPRESATLMLSGPTSYTHLEVAELVKGVTGRAVEIVPVSDDVLLERLKAADVPETWARVQVAVDANIRAGNNDFANDTLELLARRKPVLLSQFLDTNQAALMSSALASPST